MPRSGGPVSVRSESYYVAPSPTAAVKESVFLPEPPEIFFVTISNWPFSRAC
jgi:hypothetical protein